MFAPFSTPALGRGPTEIQVPTARRLRRGSIFRGGASVVATGASVAQQIIAAGASGTFTMQVVEDTHLGQLVIYNQAAVPLIVTEISIDNDGVINGEIPADMFRADSLWSPVFGHFVSKNSTVTVTLANRDGATSTVAAPAFNSLPVNSQ